MPAPPPIARPGRRGWLRASAVLALSPALPVRGQIVEEFGAGALKGAGSTFAHPLMDAWAREYRTYRKGGGISAPAAGSGLDDEIGGVALDYEAVGSQAGIARVRARAVDFAVSEMPLSKPFLVRDALLQVPLVTGAVAVAANLPGTTARVLRLPGALLADIFLGRVRNWSDPAIAQSNPGIALPNAPIAVLHRADGSGTTYTFTRFLSEASSDWKTQVGSELLVNWPAGEGFKGSAGIARALERTPHAIAYLSQVQTAASLVVASVQNPLGQFVTPTSASVLAAAQAAPWDASNGFDRVLVNAAGDRSYPIVATVFGLINDRTSGYRRRLARAFFDWSLTEGRAVAERLGYTALPPAAVRQARSVLA